MKPAKIKPLGCPCCGNEAEVISGRLPPTYYIGHVVRCTRCALTTGPCWHMPDAVFAWNRRPTTPRPTRKRSKTK